MPKVEKDPIPESETRAADSWDQENAAHAEIAELDVGKALRQQLDSFRRAGMTFVPKGTGEYEFSFENESDAAETKAPQSQPLRQEAPSLSVGESSPQFVVQSDSAVAAELTADSKATSPAIPATAGPETATPENAAAETAAAETAAASKPKPTRRSAKSGSTQSRLVDTSPYGTSLGLTERQSALNVLQHEVAGCTQCKELADSRTQTVFGVGNPGTRLVFLGEGPGANEDRLGEPFVGEAGQLLDKIMGACKLSRSDVYILNTVKCRPPANRNPSQDELANCWGYAEKQLEIIQPEFICCLGSVAARTLLKTTQSIGRLRRQFHAYRGSRVLVTYHPAYLLRTPSAKKHVWEDMKLLMKEMGVDLSN